MSNGNKNNFNKDYIVTGLGEYFSTIRNLTNNFDCGVLWFRGHEDITYKLLPNLYRDSQMVRIINKPEIKNRYTSIHLRENMRMQHYYAKNFPFIKGDNLNPLEWMGVAQHHGLHTRLLDWSTSAVHALVFALEKYLNNKQGLTGTPCVWILEPQAMNKKVVENLLGNKKLYRSLIDSFKIDLGGGDTGDMYDFLNDIKPTGYGYRVY